jgi:hypothetical protein
MLVPFADLAFVVNGTKKPDPHDPRLRQKLRARDVLLTVPHGAPGNDAVAPEVGITAHERLRAHGSDSVLLVSRVCRYAEQDMNRPAARIHPYRQAVRVALRAKPRFFLDVHSFPNDYEHYRGRDIILLHTPRVTDKAALEDYAVRLRKAAKQLGRLVRVEVQDQHQKVVHDLIREARELGMPADRVILAEMNESGNPALYGCLHDMAIRTLLQEPENAR